MGSAGIFCGTMITCCWFCAVVAMFMGCVAQCIGPPPAPQFLEVANLIEDSLLIPVLPLGPPVAVVVEHHPKYFAVNIMRTRNMMIPNDTSTACISVGECTLMFVYSFITG